jgi:hypothetical protein
VLWAKFVLKTYLWYFKTHFISLQQSFIKHKIFCLSPDSERVRLPLHVSTQHENQEWRICHGVAFSATESGNCVCSILWYLLCFCHLILIYKFECWHKKLHCASGKLLFLTKYKKCPSLYVTTRGSGHNSEIFAPEFKTWFTSNFT